MKFLINPPTTGQKRRSRKMARRLPPRYKSGPKRGQFMSKRARSSKKKTRRRNIGRTVAAAGTSNPRRNLMGTLMDATIEAGQILVGKAAVRTIPDLAGLPRAGNLGIAVQAGTALALGFVANMFVSRSAARAITAGALTAPLETLIVSYQIPWLSQALSPVAASGNLSSYVQGAKLGQPGGSAGIGRYVRAPRVSRVSAARGMGNGGYN